VVYLLFLDKKKLDKLNNAKFKNSS
jgi:hypothetical protein